MIYVKECSACVFSRTFIVFGLMLRSLMHVEFVFVYDIRRCSNFILLHVAIQFSQHHLLKRLSFQHSVVLLMYCWIWFASILLKISLCSSVMLICNFLFLWYLWFWYWGDGSLIQWVWECSFLCNFCEEFRRIGVNFSLNVWWNLPVKPSDPGLLSVGSFKSVSVSVLMTGLSIFYFFLVQSWETVPF